LIGGLVLGTLDISFAITFWGIGYGVSPVRVLQSVARGVLGNASFEGGARTAVLGGVLHYAIAICMAVAFYLASQRLPALIRRPVAWGVAYGIVLYLVMNLVVLPLSAVGMPRFNNVPWVALSVVMHGCFGVICALAARRARTPA
jgi:uncharacterized protein YacL